jgi:hypothetical protein
LKKLIRTTIKITMALAILATLSLTLYIQHQALTYDPIKDIYQLRNQHRRDEALDLARFFREFNPDNPDYARLEEELDYSMLETLKSTIWNGMIKGEVFDTPSGIGAIAADMTLFGDIRDLIIQGWKIITGDPDLDKTSALLSGAGVALTLTPCIDGCGAFVKSTVKYIHRFPAIMEKGILKAFASGRLSADDYEKIWGLLKKTNGRFREPFPTLATFPTPDTSTLQQT